jgi:hypothetical protein
MLRASPRREQLAALDEQTRPSLNFPAGFLAMAPMFMNGGTTVNGQSTPPWPMAPQNDRERY